MRRHDRHDKRSHDPSRGRLPAALFERNDEVVALEGGLVYAKPVFPTSLK
jgi:hypothetical protein